MFTNQDFRHLNDALTLKSALHEIANREANTLERILPNNTTNTFNVRDIDRLTGLPLPDSDAIQVQLGFLPKNDEVIGIKDEHGDVVYSKVVIPDAATEQPYLRKLTREEALSLKGSRTRVEVIQAANSIVFDAKTPKRSIKSPVFLESGERLIFSIYNRVLSTIEEQSVATYILELVFAIVLAILAIMVMWTRAIQSL